MTARNRTVWLIAGIAVALTAFALETHAQSHEGFIYGKVYTNKNTYTGAIRWGKEEVLWTDLFNAAKTDKTFDKLVPKDNSGSWGDYDWSFGSIWESSTTHQFTCQFGNFKEMRMINGDEVIIKLKNGGEIRVEDDGNDMGENVHIMDPELGIINIDWDRIDKIEFLPTPAKLNQVFGMPLYGTVEGVRKEKYTGFIIWDNDERLTTDKLDGDSDDGDVSIEFKDITTIEKRGSRGCNVTTKTGRSLYLTGSNDVNDGNRGVFVVSPEIGIVKFSWDAFRKLTLATPQTTGQSYNEFTAPKFMTGTVSRLDGADISGQIVYDIDETIDFEIIEGVENDIEYMIPLKNIRSITPKNYDYSELVLVSGQTLLLGDGRDVSAKNAGLLVFQKGKKDPVFVNWRKVNQITFR